MVGTFGWVPGIWYHFVPSHNGNRVSSANIYRHGNRFSRFQYPAGILFVTSFFHQWHCFSFFVGNEPSLLPLFLARLYTIIASAPWGINFHHTAGPVHRFDVGNGDSCEVQLVSFWCKLFPDADCSNPARYIDFSINDDTDSAQPEMVGGFSEVVMPHTGINDKIIALQRRDPFHPRPPMWAMVQSLKWEMAFFQAPASTPSKCGHTITGDGTTAISTGSIPLLLSHTTAGEEIIQHFHPSSAQSA